MAVRVVLAEDNALLRESLRELLQHSDDLDVVAAVGSLGALVEAVGTHLPDVVLTDIRMPPHHLDEGIVAADTIRRSHPDIGVLVLSSYDDAAYALRLLAGGARGRGYLLKDQVADVGELAAAVRRVADGGSVVDPRVVDGLLRGPRSDLDRLTPREREVLALMATGRHNAAIAETLVVTVRAVERHINAIFAKLGLAEDLDHHRRVRAVLMFLGRP